MRVRRSGGGARPEANRAAAPRRGSSSTCVLDPRRGSSPLADREDKANGEKETGGRRGRRPWAGGGGASGLWIWELGWRLERIEFYREHDV
jgi:hypothetical protein